LFGSDASVTLSVLYCSRTQEHDRGERTAWKEVMIMQNTINNRWDIPCYSFIAIYPGNVSAFFRRIISLFKAALAVR
jgi:hypothetical protein